MPRKRTATRKNGNHTKAQMELALSLICSGTSIRKAGREVGISHNTVRRYFQKTKNCDSPKSVRLTPNYANRIVFKELEEETLKTCIKCFNEMFYGITSFECRKLAFQFAIIKGKTSIRNTWKVHSMAGLDWLRGFRRRHPDISLKKYLPYNATRTTLLNKQWVDQFYDKLSNFTEAHEMFYNGRRIYNLDEFAITLLQQPEKIAPQNEINSSTVVNSKDEMITICCIVSANGQVLPPVIVFPREKIESQLLDGAPLGSLELASTSGRMNSELFVDAIKHFIKHSHSSLAYPTLLIIDNDESHFSIEALELAKTAGVTILVCPPNSTSMLQPLDVGVLAPFKEYYNSDMDSLLLIKSEPLVTIKDVTEIIVKAFQRAMTLENIVKAFRQTGILPFDRNVLSDERLFLVNSDTTQTVSLSQCGDTNEDSSNQHTISQTITEEKHVNFNQNIFQDVHTDCMSKKTKQYAHCREDIPTSDPGSTAQELCIHFNNEQCKDNKNINSMQSDDESLDTDTRSFNAMIPKPMGSSIPNIAEIVSSPDRLNEPADVPIKLETDYSLLKEEDDLESVSDISATNHWQTETKPDFQFNGFNEDDDNEQYESKSMNQLKRMALIAQTKMFKAQEAAARSKEQLNLYKVAILKQRNGDT